MKYPRSQVQSKAHAMPELRFEDQTLTSFAGLVLFQKFFASIDLKSRLRRCLEPWRSGKVFHPATVFLQLIVHLLLGFRELQDSRYYRDDPLVQRLLGLRRLPTVATVSRVLKQATAQSVDALRGFLRERVLDGLRTFQPIRVTLGALDPATCRRNRRGIQQEEEERGPQLLPAVLYGRSDRPSPRFPLSARQRA